MIAPRTVITTAFIGLGILLSVNTTATAEVDAFAALRAYDSADAANRKIWELIFGNTQNGIHWANSVLIQRKQQPLYCAPDNFSPTGPEALAMLREMTTSNPKLLDIPYGFVLLLALQKKYPCP
jgi:hypothetical protein